MRTKTHMSTTEKLIALVNTGDQVMTPCHGVTTGNHEKKREDISTVGQVDRPGVTIGNHGKNNIF